MELSALAEEDEEDISAKRFSLLGLVEERSVISTFEIKIPGVWKYVVIVSEFRLLVAQFFVVIENFQPQIYYEVIDWYCKEKATWLPDFSLLFLKLTGKSLFVARQLMR